MLASFRSALLMIAALTATTIAPAEAGPSGEPLLPATAASTPEVATPQLLDPQGEPTLSEPKTTDTQDLGDEPADQPAVKPTGDLASMVAQMRGPEAGSRELDCLATGIYFESKSEPLAGQLAVGKVIANRAASNGRHDQARRKNQSEQPGGNGATFGAFPRRHLARFVDLQLALLVLGDDRAIFHRDRRRAMHLLEHVADRLGTIHVRIDGGLQL